MAHTKGLPVFLTVVMSNLVVVIAAELLSGHIEGVDRTRKRSESHIISKGYLAISLLHKIRAGVKVA